MNNKPRGFSRFQVGLDLRCFVFACVTILVAIIDVGQVAADEKATAKEDAKKTAEPIELSKQEWAQIATLPARYNGRQTTWESVASVMLKQVSGTDSPLDEVSTIEWFLQTISRHQVALNRRVFAVVNEELAETLDLPAREKSRKGERRYSFLEMVKVEQKLKQITAVARENPVADQTDLNKAAFDLQAQIMDSIKLQYAHLFPLRSESSQIRSILQLSANAHEWNVVRIVPAKDTMNPWQTLLAAESIDLLQRFQNDKEHEPNKFSNSLRDLLLAYRGNDAPKFTERLNDYTKLVRDLPKAAFDFSVPEGWTERGVPRPFALEFHTDTLSLGTNVMSLVKEGKRGSLFVNANHFPGNTFDEGAAINGWRMSHGHLPINSSAIAALQNSAKISGHSCKRIVIDTPKNWPRSENGQRTRSVSYIVQHDAGAWVFSLFGPMEDCRDLNDEFTEFIASIRIGSADGIKSWLSIRPQKEPDQSVTGAKLIVGIASRDDWIWAFRMTGDADLVESNKSKIIEFVKTLKQHPGTIKASELKLPKSWDVYPQTKGFMLRTQDGKQMAEAEITPFAKSKQLDKFSILTYLNFFQKRFGYQKLDKKSVAKLTSTITTNTGEIIIAELSTPERKVAANQPPVVPAGPQVPVDGPAQKAKGIHYLTPKGWKPIPPGSFAAVKFKAGKNSDVTVSVTALAIGAGGDAALIMNVNRWRQQIGLPVQPGKQLIAGLKVIKIDGVVTHVADLAGTSKKILGSITFHNNKAWFTKAIGPLDSVDDEYDRFEFFMKNLKFAD